MTHQISDLEFGTIIDAQIARSRDVLVMKGAEYATEVDDRLHNFRVAADLMGTSPRVALAGMMVKHTTSIYDMLSSNHSDFLFPKELWDEKITDHINYLLLLQAIITEEHRNA